MVVKNYTFRAFFVCFNSLKVAEDYNEQFDIFFNKIGPHKNEVSMFKAVKT